MCSFALSDDARPAVPGARPSASAFRSQRYSASAGRRGDSAVCASWSAARDRFRRCWSSIQRWVSGRATAVPAAAPTTARIAELVAAARSAGALVSTSSTTVNRCSRRTGFPGLGDPPRRKPMPGEPVLRKHPDDGLNGRPWSRVPTGGRAPPSLDPNGSRHRARCREPSVNRLAADRRHSERADLPRETAGGHQAADRLRLAGDA